MLVYSWVSPTAYGQGLPCKEIASGNGKALLIWYRAIETHEYTKFRKLYVQMNALLAMRYTLSKTGLPIVNHR